MSFLNKFPIVNRIAGNLSRSVAPEGAGGATPTTAEEGSKIALPPNAEKAVVAAGCFWGVEHIFRKHFAPGGGGGGGGGKGLLDARVGYVGGTTSSPTYREVCGGATGHAEACLLVYDPSVLSYRQILEFFYRTHDPTTADAQGADRGTQYRSAIFTFGAEQREDARLVTRLADEQWWGGKVVTEIRDAGTWWDAEDYHQEYLDKNPHGYQCPTHYVRTFAELRYE